jgi:hypothetical protein
VFLSSSFSKSELICIIVWNAIMNSAIAVRNLLTAPVCADRTEGYTAVVISNVAVVGLNPSLRMDMFVIILCLCCPESLGA